MSQTRVIGQVAIAVSVSLLAGAIAYFGLALTRLADQLPQTTQSVSEISESLAPIVKLVPDILQESKDIRLQTNAVIEQSEAIITVLPDILERVDSVVDTVEKVRGDSTEFLAESAALRAEVERVRQELPAILKELEAYRVEIAGYRDLAPQFLNESKAIRASIDPTLSRVEALVADIDQTASTAGESAVSGFFTGIIKAPFSLMSDITKAITPSGRPLTAEQRRYLESTLGGFVSSASVGEVRSFRMADGDFAGEIELLSESVDGDRGCRQIRIVAFDPKHTDQKTSNDFNVCRDKNGQWSARAR